MNNIENLIRINLYISHLGIELENSGGNIISHLPFKHDLVGNPMLPAIHGGVIAATMEITALAQLMFVAKLIKPPKTIDVSIDYLRSGKPQKMFAKALIFKHGRRVANVEAFAWQEDENKPIAKLHGNFLIG